MVIFLVFGRAKYLKPNEETDQKFCKILKEAASNQVEILAIRLKFDGKSLYYVGKLPVKLN